MSDQSSTWRCSECDAITHNDDFDHDCTANLRAQNATIKAEMHGHLNDLASLMFLRFDDRQELNKWITKGRAILKGE